MTRYGDGQAHRIKRVRAAASSGWWLAALVVVLALGITGNLSTIRVEAAPAAFQTEPEADPCAAPQMIVRNAAVNVRQGPDPDYSILLVVRRGEELPVVGRHQGFPWWAVELPDGRTGWVWSTVVEVTGDLASLPLLPAPVLGGQVPDTSEVWTPVIGTPCVNPPQVTEDEPASEVPATPAPTPDSASDQRVTLDQGWTAPLNLSYSGGTSNPILVVEQGVGLHAIWADAYSGTVYRQLGSTGWSAPVTLTVPFSETQAQVLADNGGQLHVFWTDEDGLLQSAHKAADSLAATDIWTGTAELTTPALTLKSIVDDSGNLHVAYIRTEETAAEAAGVYYRRSTDGGETWSPPTVLYASPYFRGIALDNSNIQIAGGAGSERLYVAWDNRARKRVFLARSEDGGETWQEPEEVAGPDSTSSIVLPFDIRVQAEGDRLLLVWQHGQPGVQCQRVSRWSEDGGASWDDTRQLVDLNPGFASCASENKPLAGNQLFYLWTEVDNQIYLQAWNGDEWSQPERQTALSGFNDPDTLNSVVLGCFQPLVVDGQRLLLLACGSAGTLGDNDIWFTERPLETALGWFPPPSEWTTAAVVDEATSSYAELSLVSDPGAQVHALWSTMPGADGAEGMVYYSRHDEEQWLTPVTLFASAKAPGGPLAVAAGPDGRLYVAWRDVDGVISFSHVEAEDAALAQEWAPPTTLGDAAVGAGGLALRVDRAGVVYVAYTVPVNEGRGLYYVWTEDQGASWSEAVQVLDGETLGWEIVGRPEMAISGNGTLHFVAARETLQATGREATSLSYVRCASRVVDCSQPSAVGSSAPRWQATVAGATLVHRVWQEQEGDVVTVYHDSSNNDGLTWSPAQQVTSLVDAGPGSVAADVAGGLHLFQLEGSDIVAWLWEEGVWRQDGTVAAGAEIPFEGIVGNDGKVTVLLARQAEVETEGEEAEPGKELLVTSRQLELGAALPQPAALPTPIPEALPTAGAPPSTPSPTATAVLPLTDGGNAGGGETPGGTSASNPVLQIGAGILPAVLLLVAVLVFATRSLWLRRY